MPQKRLLLFGGTFDPPHNGHLNILENAAQKIKPDKILIMPAFVPPHKTAYGTSAELRIKMCRALSKKCENAEISDIEIKRGGKSYTIDTVAQLKQIYPDYRIYLVVGSDMLLYFEKWKDWQCLLREVTVFCQCRLNADVKAVAEYVKFLRKNGGRVIVCNKSILEITSTNIRARVQNGVSVSELVPDGVLKLIEENNLYKKK